MLTGNTQIAGIRIFISGAVILAIILCLKEESAVAQDSVAQQPSCPGIAASKIAIDYQHFRGYQVNYDDEDRLGAKFSMISSPLLAKIQMLVDGRFQSIFGNGTQTILWRGTLTAIWREPNWRLGTYFGLQSKSITYVYDNVDSPYPFDPKPIYFPSYNIGAFVEWHANSFLTASGSGGWFSAAKDSDPTGFLAFGQGYFGGVGINAYLVPDIVVNARFSYKSKYDFNGYYQIDEAGMSEIDVGIESLLSEKVPVSATAGLSHFIFPNTITANLFSLGLRLYLNSAPMQTLMDRQREGIPDLHQITH